MCQCNLRTRSWVFWGPFYWGLEDFQGLRWRRVLSTIGREARQAVLRIIRAHWFLPERHLWPKWPVAYPAGPYSTSNPLESQIYSQKTQSESALNSLSPYPGRVNTVFPPAWIPELNTERTFLTEPSKNSLFLQSIRGSV